ncbi:hypothetical protein PPYR_14335 [Photinus pyralis]|uniref:Protein with SprT-like domain at the N terminus n=1 Tax=Photinus pyralis TaxID=7054 RepID=A0A1Y1LCH4_PHOPY|nr:sprT-like domain-containing protein Spartan [Photinus pyralis]KAB0792376.1 hypothetical protein PPYR_14335 [Photinus pyralis]
MSYGFVVIYMHGRSDFRMAETSDYEFASLLQQQFNHEVEIENPGKGLVYSGRKATQEDDKSLTDPSWELIDPTPNIHLLFVAFNGKYFWNKLITVCVSWSKRMTSCAGICSYQGSGGFCHITLSEPLLKLRPRKDLIETLLHEMIHAYLFVTHNNKDHDSHGPQFQKHMHRINTEAGTNITVYHSFHDEVNLYKQHWWKCTGPCQYRKPYFGMVRRAMNRAPGPNDNWWDEHKSSCNGTFVKIKEPEKRPKKLTKENNIQQNDIRNHFPVDTQAGKGYKRPREEELSETDSKPTISKSEVVECIDLTSQSSSDYSIVRNSWLQRFPLSCNSKRSALESLENIDERRQKKTDELKSSIESEQKVKCPICNNGVLPHEINSHVDVCLNLNAITDDFEIGINKTQAKAYYEKTYDCPLCFKQFPFEDISSHINACCGEETRVTNNSLNDMFSDPF